MSTDTWLAISAGATFLLALAAFWAIWQNHNLQKRERRDRLLNEIIEWAIDVAKCETQADFLSRSRKSMLIGLLFKYQAIDAKSEYMKVTAVKFREDDFQVTVNETAQKLKDHLDILEKQIEGKTTAEERDKHWRSLMESSATLARKAAEIKTKDVS